MQQGLILHILILVTFLSCATPPPIATIHKKPPGNYQNLIGKEIYFLEPAETLGRPQNGKLLFGGAERLDFAEIQLPEQYKSIIFSNNESYNRCNPSTLVDILSINEGGFGLVFLVRQGNGHFFISKEIQKNYSSYQNLKIDISQTFFKSSKSKDLCKGTVWTGMSLPELVFSINRYPSKINTTNSSGRTLLQVIYAESNYYYFENEILNSWQFFD